MRGLSVYKVYYFLTTINRQLSTINSNYAILKRFLSVSVR